MKIIELEKPKLPRVKMTCDEAIDAKLERIPAIKQCWSKSSVTLVSAAMGAGKTSLVLQLVKGIFSGCFADIFVMMPENSYNSIDPRHNVFSKLPPENIYHEFNEDVLAEIYCKLEENAGNKDHSLVIIDDFGADMKQKRNEQILNRICLKNRHLRTSVMMLTQNYYMLGKKIREIVNNIVIFNSGKSQMKKFFDEQFHLKESQFDELMGLIPTRHDYLVINLNYKKIYHNWNLIEFDP